MTSFESPYQSYAGGMLFSRRCPQCGRFVAPDENVFVSGLEDYVEKPDGNAACSKCGRVEMPFLGFYDDPAVTP
jgi:uncharacterized OB-fold protein